MSVQKAGKHVWTCDSTGMIFVWNPITLTVVKEIDSGQGRVFSMNSGFQNHIWTGSEKKGKSLECRDDGSCKRN